MEAVQQSLITEEQIITPVVEVLNKVTVPSEPTPQAVSDVLDALFPEQKYEEKARQQTKAILGELAANFTPEQLKDTAVEIQYLVDTWLDDFERQIFKGQTLKELLHEKGSL